MPVYRFVVQFNFPDPRSSGLLRNALALGFNDLRRIECQDLYFVEGQLSQSELQQLALKLLIDPITQVVEWDEPGSARLHATLGIRMVEVALRPGVTDPVAEQIIRAAHELGLSGAQRAATGLRYLLDGLSEERTSALAKNLLVNTVIQHWAPGELEPAFPAETTSSGMIEVIHLLGVSDEQLLAVSRNRRAALDLAEMRAVRDYFQAAGRDPNDIEFETIAQTWSEHCVHKTFKARVTLDDGREINSIIKSYLKTATEEIAAPWVISAFVDNAGIIEFDDEFEVSFKVETHNHPSAIEPFGGANTGVGGVIRDVIAVSAKPIANTDILCFGPQDLDPAVLPAGVLHPRRIQNGVVAGIQDYGNKIGIPTVNGAIFYDPGYTSNPLVFCGCVGICPRGRHRKTPQAGDHIILLGGRTGRDGLRGATFSSMTMDAQTGEVSGASVQIGDPIVEKGLIEVILRARDLGLYDDITDCGAGGLSSAAGEMAASHGADIELEDVRLKYPGLAPWEIWLSEAQERMVLAVPIANLPALLGLCDTFDTELTDIGQITSNGRLIVRYGGRAVLDLENEFLHNGIPQRQLRARLENPERPYRTTAPGGTEPGPHETLLKLLSHPNLASKAATIRLYDHEIQGGTIIKPLVGLEADAPSDAAVLKPIGTKGLRGIVLSNGINPEYGKRDAYRMAWAAVDEAVRNAVSVGADPGRIAILDNFCWGDPNRPETLGALVEAVRGCHDAALHYQTPFISGKDSLNNEYLGSDGRLHSIPPTLLISAIGFIPDISQAVSMDFKAPGNPVYLVGEFQPSLAGSYYNLVSGLENTQDIPAPSLQAPRIYQAFHQAATRGVVRSAHDLSEGGLLTALAEMCIGGRFGFELALPIETAPSAFILFGESNGCLLVEVSPSRTADFENLFSGLPLLKIGSVTSNLSLKFPGTEIPVGELVRAFHQNL